MSRNSFVWLYAFVFCLITAARSDSQDVTKPPARVNTAAPAGAKAPAKPPAKPGKVMKITEQVRPAFLIDPIVNRIEARRGKVLPVEFAITNNGIPTTLEIRPVALTQDENGTIFPNDKVPAPQEFEILTPGIAELKANDTYVIKGRVRVPDVHSTFHTFGLLVRDAGQLKSQPNPEKPDGPRVGIRFVTQYLLRCDVSVQGVKAENAAKLLVESAELVEIDGVPVARVYVSNPTEGPIEFGLRSQIRLSQESDERPTFPLGMPVRSNLEEPDKYIGRILSGAKIRMEAPLSKPIFPGQYYIEASLLGDNRVLAKSGFPIVVEEGDYPAQGIATVLAAPGLLASPSQIELSLQRGGNRAEVLNFQNDSLVATAIEVVAETLEGQPADWVSVRPQTLALAPGAARKVSVTLSASGDPNPHRYARLRVKSTPAGGAVAESTPIVVALIGRATTQPTLEAGELISDTTASHPTFVIDVKNTGARHMPVEAQLTLGDENGRPIDIRGGFGKWILPGASERVRFNPPKSLPAGKYTARLRIPTGGTSEPIEKRLEFDLTGAQP